MGHHLARSNATADCSVFAQYLCTRADPEARLYMSFHYSGNWFVQLAPINTGGLGRAHFLEVMIWVKIGAALVRSSESKAPLLYRGFGYSHSVRSCFQETVSMRRQRLGMAAQHIYTLPVVPGPSIVRTVSTYHESSRIH